MRNLFSSLRRHGEGLYRNERVNATDDRCRVMPNLNHKAKRDLLAEMLYTRPNDAGKKVEVTRHGYAYDALGHIKMLKIKHANGKNVKSV